MNKDARKALCEDALIKLEEMKSGGENVKQLLLYLSEVDSNHRLYSFYLAEVFGRPLDGSIYLSHWNNEKEETKKQILVILESSALEIQAEKDIGGELTASNISKRLGISETELNALLNNCPIVYQNTSTSSPRKDGQVFGARFYFKIKDDIHEKNS